MESHNERITLAGMTSLLLLAASLLGFSSVMGTTTTALASPIDNAITGGGGTPATTMLDITSSLNVSDTANTTTDNIELREEPFAIGHYRQVSQNLINETLPLQIVLEGSTTITLPNTTEIITTIDTGEAIISALPGGGIVRGHIQMMATTEEGFESAIAYFTEYFLDESPTAINLAYFTTNSTGMLAPLNNMIAVSLDEEQPNGDVIVRLFEWEGGSSTRSRAPTTTIGDNNNSTIGG